MAKIRIFIIAFIFHSSAMFAQMSECDLGIDSAKKDLDRGISRVYLQYWRSGSQTFGRLLSELYGIEVIYYSHSNTERMHCYSSYMVDRILERNGEDFLKRIKSQANRLDSLGLGDRKASFPGGVAEFRMIVYCNIDLENARFNGVCEGTVYLDFSIDMDGSVCDVSIHDSPNEAYSKEVLRLFASLPKWTNATKNGHPVKSSFMMGINIDPGKIKEFCP